MTALVLDGIGHAILGRTILDGVDLAVPRGEIVALVGPSGSGKSTLAHIAAGLTEPRTGRVQRRYQRLAMIFQDPALLPWATARGNIAYPLGGAGVARRDRPARVAEAAARVALEPGDLDKYPVELSGGMRQRAAIARALAVRPDFVIFDEPFTALDVALRQRMQNLVIDTCAAGDVSGLFITHDLTEAARVAHRIAVLDTYGRGILGSRAMDDAPQTRSEDAALVWVRSGLKHDPLFRHIHDVDERQIA